jgi:hypothetical protein
MSIWARETAANRPSSPAPLGTGNGETSASARFPSCHFERRPASRGREISRSSPWTAVRTQRHPECTALTGRRATTAEPVSEPGRVALVVIAFAHHGYALVSRSPIHASDRPGTAQPAMVRATRCGRPAPGQPGSLFETRSTGSPLVWNDLSSRPRERSVIVLLPSNRRRRSVRDGAEVGWGGRRSDGRIHDDGSAWYSRVTHGLPHAPHNTEPSGVASLYRRGFGP